MGMFDHVKFEHDCPHCGAPLKDFQSKSGPCELKKVKAHWVDNFYAFCDCGAYINFARPFRKKRWRRTVMRNSGKGHREHVYAHDAKFSKRQLKEQDCA